MFDEWYTIQCMHLFIAASLAVLQPVNIRLATQHCSYAEHLQGHQRAGGRSSVQLPYGKLPLHSAADTPYQAHQPQTNGKLTGHETLTPTSCLQPTQTRGRGVEGLWPTPTSVGVSHQHNASAARGTAASLAQPDAASSTAEFMGPQAGPQPPPSSTALPTLTSTSHNTPPSAASLHAKWSCSSGQRQLQPAQHHPRPHCSNPAQHTSMPCPTPSRGAALPAMPVLAHASPLPARLAACSTGSPSEQTSTCAPIWAAQHRQHSGTITNCDWATPQPATHNASGGRSHSSAQQAAGPSASPHVAHPTAHLHSEPRNQSCPSASGRQAAVDMQAVPPSSTPIPGPFQASDHQPPIPTPKSFVSMSEVLAAPEPQQQHQQQLPHSSVQAELQHARPAPLQGHGSCNSMCHASGVSAGVQHESSACNLQQREAPAAPSAAPHRSTSKPAQQPPIQHDQYMHPSCGATTAALQANGRPAAGSSGTTSAVRLSGHAAQSASAAGTARQQGVAQGPQGGKEALLQLLRGGLVAQWLQRDLPLFEQHLCNIDAVIDRVRHSLQLYLSTLCPAALAKFKSSELALNF